MLKSLVRLLKALNGNGHPGEIAHAFCCGMLLGFLPKNNLLWYVIFLLFLFLRINKGAFLLSILCGSFFAVFLDPLFDAAGYAVLTLPSLASPMAFVMNIPFVVFTRINNSVILGSVLCALVLYVPLYFLVRFFIVKWRVYLAPNLAGNPVVIWFMRLPFIKMLRDTYLKVGSFNE